MTCSLDLLRRMRGWWPLAMAGATGAAVAGVELAPATAGQAPTRAVVLPAPGVEIKYELVGPQDDDRQARVAGSVQAIGGTLHTSFGLDPDGERRIQRQATRWEAALPGALQRVTLGDIEARGGGWSRDARLGGLRVGSRPAQAGPLGAGATDYDLQFGTLAEPHVQAFHGPEGHATGRWRAGMGDGFTAEWRSEWSPVRTAHGLELQQDLGPAGSVQAVLARSDAAGSAGLRWGMAVEHRLEHARLLLDYDAAARGFTPLVGAQEARSGLRIGTAMDLGPSVAAEVALQHQVMWDAPAPDASISLTVKMALPQQARVSLGVSRHVGPELAWRSSLSVSVPLDR